MRTNRLRNANDRMRMDLRQAQSFVTVARTLHFGRAAAELGIATSAVSQQVSRLERQWGLELFERTSRRVNLTKAGIEMLPLAERLLNIEAEAAALAQRLRARDDERVRVLTSPGSGVAILQLRKAAAAAQIEISLDCASRGERAAAVLGGSADVAIFRGGGSLDPEQFDTTPLWWEEILLGIPEDFPLDESRPVLPQLAAVPLLLTSRAENSDLVDLVLNATSEAGFTPNTVGRTFDVETALNLVGGVDPHWWVGYRSHIELYRAPGVRFVSADPPLKLPTLAVTAADQRISDSTLRFLDLARSIPRANPNY